MLPLKWGSGRLPLLATLSLSKKHAFLGGF